MSQTILFLKFNIIINGVVHQFKIKAAMINKLEGVHMGFLHYVTRMKEQSLGDKTWKKGVLDRVLQVTGTKPLREYIDKRQAVIA